MECVLISVLNIYLSDVALMAESGILPDVIPKGFITLHSGSRIHFIGLGFIRM